MNAGDDGDGDGVGGSGGTSEALKREAADRTSSRNLQKAPFSGWVDYIIHPLSDNRAQGRIPWSAHYRVLATRQDAAPLTRNI